jgi:hypothetical protein
VHRELVVYLISILLCDKVSFLSLLFRNLNLEFFGNLTSDWVVKSVQELTNDSECFRNNATNLSRVIANLASLDGDINDAYSSE